MDEIIVGINLKEDNPEFSLHRPGGGLPTLKSLYLVKSYHLGKTHIKKVFFLMIGPLRFYTPYINGLVVHAPYRLGENISPPPPLSIIFCHNSSPNCFSLSLFPLFLPFFSSPFLPFFSFPFIIFSTKIFKTDMGVGVKWKIYIPELSSVVCAFFSEFNVFPSS